MGSLEKVMHDHFHMRKVSALWIPRLLTSLQKQERVESSKAPLTAYQGNQEVFS